MRWILPILLLLAGLGCAQAPRPVDSAAVGRDIPSLDGVTLQVADVPPEVPFTVTIALFDPVEMVSSSLQESLAQVRSMERRYLPYQLKLTLERSGWFGPVRVMPVIDPSSELVVTARILASDGVVLGLSVKAQDAGGGIWIDGEYWDHASEIDYATDPEFAVDPFQGLYNQIANDLIAAYRKLPRAERIIDIASMRYAAILAPEYFGRYLSQSPVGLILEGLPAADDPNLERVNRIRDSEYLFSDSVDAHYESLYRQLGQTYAWWRYYSYELISGNERLAEIDGRRGATRGSWYSMERIYKTYREARMNEDALRELTDAFDRETSPTVTELAGRVVELRGTLSEQHEAWRTLMKHYYESEFND